MALINQIFEVFYENIFVLTSGLLIFGFLFGQMVRPFKMPRVSGYIITGIILGPSLLKIINEASLVKLDFITQLTLGLIAMIIGAGLSFSLIKRLGWGVILITLLQALGAFVLVFILLFLLKMPLEAALPLAAIATATDPAATIAVIKEFRSRGTLTETVLAVVALDDAVAIIMFGLVLTVDLKHLSTLGETALHSLSVSALEIIGALILGLVLGILAHLLLKATKELSDSLIILLGMVLLTVGLANFFEVSPLLANMFLGLAIINISSKNSELTENLGRLTPPIYCLFFVISGASLNMKVFARAGLTLILWGAGFVLMRIFGKIGGAYVGGVVSNASDNIRKYLGLTLIPQAGVAVGLPLLITASSSFYEFRPLILNLTLLAVAANVIIGPVCTKIALFKAKEASVEE